MLTITAAGGRVEGLNGAWAAAYRLAPGFDNRPGSARDPIQTFDEHGQVFDESGNGIRTESTKARSGRRLGGDSATEAIPRNDMAYQNHDDKQLRSARGNTRSSDHSKPRPAWYHWTDPETGERLRVELWSSEAFLAGLELAGFEPLQAGPDAIDPGHADPKRHGPGRTRHGSSVRSSAEATRDRGRAGSTPPQADGDAA